MVHIYISLVPRLFGGGEKRAWYLLFAHALNYSTFQIFWISPGTFVLCWRHQPISRTLNLYVKEMDRSCTLLNASAVLLWLWKTNKQLASRSSMKERTYFSDCLQPTGFGKSMCYEVLPFVFDYKLERRDRPTGYWSSTKTKQERIHVERRSFTTICTYVALRYPRTWVC